jgi:hypothetical protein
MKVKYPVVLFFGVLLLFSSSAAMALQVPESLDYDLKWIGIKAGSSTMHVYKDEDGMIRIVSTARSAKWVTVFYPVRDRVESVLASGSPWYPVRYHLKKREGRHRKNKEVIFKRAEKKAVYVDHIKGEEKEYDLPETIYDPLSAFYRIREVDLVVGKPVYVTLFDSKKVYDLKVQVIRKEKVKVPAGTFNTVLIKVLMKSEGIFTSKGAISIWLTDDERRLPVRMRTKAPVGKINVELVGGR